MNESGVTRRLSELIDRIELLTSELERMAATGESTEDVLSSLEEVLEEYRLLKKGVNA